ncbi:hypothetical protein SAMD00019534_047860 [Acytostelium subglobosum LB1]|uniref:hypothetical protein n=1 Tax=Acytostelium subglobosum LB1 TaxID=1410327 RepID=UPI0006449501|nr:hypothetical protein SAMD00019534_047860 [Acytostelium subglobosum LB1]GAM21611.1 hypothetical protein SAMD00019534_047860 [Acytostelium subglobosum LB1]|eukprot:XP_012755730.1 hypothetical protein SAMD00019534_047860 [Acytostelium subglobosum LB1]
MQTAVLSHQTNAPFGNNGEDYHPVAVVAVSANDEDHPMNIVVASLKDHVSSLSSMFTTTTTTMMPSTPTTTTTTTITTLETTTTTSVDDDADGQLCTAPPTLPPPPAPPLPYQRSYSAPTAGAAFTPHVHNHCETTFASQSSADNGLLGLGQNVSMLPELCELFSSFRQFKVNLVSGKKEDELSKFQSQVNSLFNKDYNITIINNRNGEFCATYPPDLVVIESEKNLKCKACIERDIKRVNNPSTIQKLLAQSRFARVRTRFPFPVIYYHNKNLCRSSTLSKRIEYMLQTGVNSIKTQFKNSSSNIGNTMSNSVQSSDDMDQGGDMNYQQDMEMLRNNDINAIKNLSVKYIFDLMVENKKKKFGIYVCSSEKADVNDRYSKHFVIASTPYPGVEFFTQFNQNQHNAKDLMFDWDSNEPSAELKIDKSSIPVVWEEYKSWDLLYLTQNYLKLLLEYISDDSKDAGVLVHCISGWDRTPLFISLLRLSLWADGEIHQSLNASEILYLTVAYDWFLFSHQLSDRVARGQDIFYFCFYFLEFITSSEYSVHHYSSPKRSRNNQHHSGSVSTAQDIPAPSSGQHHTSSTLGKQTLNVYSSWKTSMMQHPGSSPTTSLSKSVDVSQSAPSTPKKESPASSLFKLHSLFSNYTSAPSSPQHSPSCIPLKPTTSSSSPLEVPGNGCNRIRSRPSPSEYPATKDCEELGGSWQLMGSLPDYMKSLSSFTSTPKCPSSGSDVEDMNHDAKDQGDDEVLAELDQSWDPNTGFIVDHNPLGVAAATAAAEVMNQAPSTVVLTEHGTPGNNKRIKQQDGHGAFANSRVRDDDRDPMSGQEEEQLPHKQQHTHVHNNNSANLSQEELSARRTQRLLEVKKLFMAIYQQFCSQCPNDSYWKTVLSYLPKSPW